jgi:hypothetical protein
MRRAAASGFQLTHHDIWDYDIPAAANLANITVNGKSVKALAQVTKQGFVYVFDRVTGEPVWPIVERPVPQSNIPKEKSSPTQPVPTRPAPFDLQGITLDDLNDLTPALHAEALEIAKTVELPVYTPATFDKGIIISRRRAAEQVAVPSIGNGCPLRRLGDRTAKVLQLVQDQGDAAARLLWGSAALTKPLCMGCRW